MSEMRHCDDDFLTGRLTVLQKAPLNGSQRPMVTETSFQLDKKFTDLVWSWTRNLTAWSEHSIITCHVRDIVRNKMSFRLDASITVVQHMYIAHVTLFSFRGYHGNDLFIPVETIKSIKILFYLFQLLKQIKRYPSKIIIISHNKS